MIASRFALLGAALAVAALPAGDPPAAALPAENPPAATLRAENAPSAPEPGADDASQTPDTRIVSEEWEILGLRATELTLANGLRIVLVPDHTVPRVAASLWYRVGALQEPLGEHGATHFLEHVIHQGTTTIGVRDLALDRRLLEEIHSVEQDLLAEFDAHRNEARERRIFFDESEWPTNPRIDSLRHRLYELEDEQSDNRIFWEEYNWYRRYGGIMRHSDPVPANTGNELMRIEVDLPRENLELFFRMEADRMVNAVLRGFEAQRFTVLEQFLGINRNPTGRFNEALNGAMAVAHPIYLHPGGHERDHFYWNRASMLEMYDDYLVPNNATLALVGDVDVDEVREMAERYFGQVPRGPEPPVRMDVEAEPPPGGSVRLDWHEPLTPMLTVRFRTPGVGHPDRIPFDAIAWLLGGDDGLLAQEAAAAGAPGASWSASASRSGSPTRLSIQARPAQDEDLPALEPVVERAIERVRRGDFDRERLERHAAERRLQWEALRTHRGDLASEIGAFSVMDEWRTMRTWHEGRRAPAPADIQRVAARYLVPWNRVTATTRREPRPEATGHLVDPVVEEDR